MKYCTAPLVNEVKKKSKIKAFFLGDSHRACYYEARHKTQDIYLLWIEAPRFGKTLTYPCKIGRASCRERVLFLV